MTRGLVNINGEILDAQNAKISVFDRGFLYGDSLYEVFRTYQGKPFLMDEHLNRLTTSARLCLMQLHKTKKQIETEVVKTLSAFKSKFTEDAYCRVIVTRGQGKIGFGLDCIDSHTGIVIIAQPVREYSEQEVRKGMTVHIPRRFRNHPNALDPAMKSGNYLNNLLAYLEANERDFDDAVLINHNGYVTEGTTFNLFYIKKRTLVTPPLSAGILDGITRRKVIEMAKSEGYDVRETDFPKERLYEADEVFATSSLREVFPVTQVDDFKKKNSQTTSLLRQAFKKWIQKNLAL